MLISYYGSGQNCDTFAYDAYGNRVDPLKYTAGVTEGLFYCGEQWDAKAKMYYLRSRYYNPLTGLFNQMDSFAGSPQDPQSLHKYLYCHANPVNNIDPEGKFSYGDVTLAMAIRSVLFLIQVTVLVGLVMEATHLLGKNILREPYLRYIKSSAIKNRLRPELVAAIIATEQYYLGWSDVLGDAPRARRGHDSSIGLGQIRISTAIQHNLVDSSDREEIIKRLMDPERNIEATARYIRIVADMAEGSKSYNPGVNFALYKHHGDEWDYNNPYTVILIGSEYNSTPWDSYYTDWWGEQVLRNFRSIEKGRYF